MHADPTCLALFAKAWSESHRRAVYSIPPFVHPWAFDPRKSPMPLSPHLSLKSTSPPSSSPAMSSVTFVFSTSSIRQCLAHLSLSDISPFDALASLLWLRIASYKDGADQAPAKLTLALDYRRRMYAPLPLGFYGNVVHFFSVQADLSSGWGHVASELSHHVAGLKEDDFWSSVEWLHERRKEKPFQMYGPELTCMALDDAQVYDTEFDAGIAPVHVACHIGGAEGEGLVVVMKGPPGEGDEARTVIATLPTDLTAKICRDEVILKYGPKVMFSPDK